MAKKEVTPVAAVEFNKIDTCNKKTINDSLRIGQVLRNGGSRIFEIVGLDETTITLLSNNNNKASQNLIMGRKVFCDLYYLKNYDQVWSINNVRKEIMDAKVTGADRYLI